MKVYFAALIIFLLAFAGLATGLILKRKGLRGGCSPAPAPGTGRDCQCKTATAPSIQVKIDRHAQRDESQEGED